MASLGVRVSGSFRDSMKPEFLQVTWQESHGLDSVMPWRRIPMGVSYLEGTAAVAVEFADTKRWLSNRAPDTVVVPDSSRRMGRSFAMNVMSTIWRQCLHDIESTLGSL
jgi:hypothetical protein